MSLDVLVRRHDHRSSLAAQDFWTLVPPGNLLANDEVVGLDGVWRPASSYPELAPFVVSPRPSPVGTLILTAALGVVGAVAAYKIAQAVGDEDFESRHFPAWFRDELISAHLDTQGAYCPVCERRVRIADLTVDHIVPWAKGGRTSRQNARVICGRCNSRKRDKVGIMDLVRGRAA